MCVPYYRAVLAETRHSTSDYEIESEIKWSEQQLATSECTASPAVWYGFLWRSIMPLKVYEVPHCTEIWPQFIWKRVCCILEGTGGGIPVQILSSKLKKFQKNIEWQFRAARTSKTRILFKYEYADELNLSKTKRSLLYIRNQSVPRSKHFPPRL